jgi:ATP-dependent Clp protease ATP-binding subunit ClpA
MSSDLRVLIGKLNSTCRRALELAAEVCVQQGNYNVEVEHLLLKLVEGEGTDIAQVLRYFDVPRADINRELQRAIEGLKRGNSRTPVLSPQIPKLLEQGWLLTSLHLNEAQVRSGPLLDTCPSLLRISRETLYEHLAELTRNSLEATGGASSASPPEPGGPRIPWPERSPSATSALDRFTLDLTDLLYGGERNTIVINLSEYQEAHTVSKLKGVPPGYVGYGKGGILTEAVRRRPYSVVLLDKVEKAHPDVLEVFYQVFDKGVMEDGEGVSINFRNTLILLTSNLGSDTIAAACGDPRKRPGWERLLELIRPELLTHFTPAFLGRLVIVPYYPLGDEAIRRIVRLKLAKLQQRFRAHHHAELDFAESVTAAIAARCTEVDSGARNIDHILTHAVLPELSTKVLEKMAQGEGFELVCVAIDAQGALSYRFGFQSESDPDPHDETAECDRDRSHAAGKWWSWG